MDQPTPAYRLVFRGKLHPGFVAEDVVSAFAKISGKSPDSVQPLFDGRAITLKKSTDRAAIDAAIEKLTAIGMVVDAVAPQASPPTKPRAEAASGASARPPKTAAPVKTSQTPIAKPIAETASHHAEVSRSQVYKYRFDNFMAQGGLSIFKVLVVVFLAAFFIIACLRGLLYAIFPDVAQQYESLDFFGNAYITFLQLTDPGNMAQDILSSPWYKLFSILAGLIGVVMLSVLIAFITTALDQKIQELKRGRSKVIETGHTLILGWNEQRIVEIIRELIIANESEDDACIVILADEDKQEMDDLLRLRLPDWQTTRIVTRSGQVSTLANLAMVSIEHAASMIILATCSDSDTDADKLASDAKAIQTILATTGRSTLDDEHCIVVELYNPTYRSIVEETFSRQVVALDTSDILAKLLVQTSRSVGLSVVYNEILSFDMSEMYFYETEWGDKSFGQLVFHFPDGVPMGVLKQDDSLLLNPPINYTMKPGDSILILADDDSTIDFQSKPVARPKRMPLPDRRLEQQVEKELLIGWNHKAPLIIREFSDYVKTGSYIDILLKSPTEDQRQQIAQLQSELDLTIRLQEINCLDSEQLISLEPFHYDNVIILANIGEQQDAQQVDSENIVTLLLLRNIFAKFPTESDNTKIITEILDSQNLPLVAKAGVKDVIISNRLLSMTIAQISENRHIKRVYDDIFQEDGSEIYLKPATLYFDHFPVTLAFADLIALVQQRDEVCLGVKIKSLESDPNANNGVQLIPEKTQRITLNRDDSVVVLAEDEL